jgi:ketosteroid isomerase-like protein
MLSTERARQIAKDWMASWNRRDLDSIRSHYSDDVEFTSPFVLKLMGESSGTIKGKEMLREYFGRGLRAYPDLKFEPLQVLTGVNSLTIYYRSVKGMLAAEVMFPGSDGKIERVVAHYSE